MTIAQITKKLGVDVGTFFDDFVTAIGVWAIMQGEPPTVAEASTAFNATPGVIRKAVNAHPWAFINGDEDSPDDATDTIEDDGE